MSEPTEDAERIEALEEELKIARLQERTNLGLAGQEMAAAYERIEALEAKCALLEASLKKADAWSLVQDVKAWMWGDAGVERDDDGLLSILNKYECEEPW